MVALLLIYRDGDETKMPKYVSIITGVIYKKYGGSYMNAHVLLNILNDLRKRDKMRGLHLITSIIQEHEC